LDIRSTIFLRLDSSSVERDQYNLTRAISIHDIGHSGTSTGITNSIRKNETTIDQDDMMFETNPSTQLSSLSKSTNSKRDERYLMQQEQKQQQRASERTFNETQFYARTSRTPIIKQRSLNYEKSDDFYSTPPIEDTFHDALNDLNTNKDQINDDKSKNNLHLSLSIVFYLLQT